MWLVFILNVVVVDLCLFAGLCLLVVVRVVLDVVSCRWSLLCFRYCRLLITLSFFNR